MKKLSIITVNLNNLAGLHKTMESVFSQTFTDYEYIIIDGGSTDGSRELIEKYKNKLVYWVSEQDNGIYHAMNKGILKAKGEYLLFLNSGDVLLKSESLNQLFSVNFSEDIIYWNMRNNMTGEEIIYPKNLRFSFFLHQTINHQSTLIKKKLFEVFGLYNEELIIVADWEFFIKTIFLYRVSTRYLPTFIVQYGFENGVSKDPKMNRIMETERKAILIKYFKGFLDDYKESETVYHNFIERGKSSIRLNKKVVFFIRRIRKAIKFDG